MIGYSHQNYLGSIADTLTEAGHDVTMLMPIYDKDLENKTVVKLTKKVIKLPPYPKNLEIFAARDAVFGNLWISQPDMRSLIQLTHNFSVSSANTCEGLLNDDKLMKQLEVSKFDVGIAEPFTMCSFGIFELLKIPATIAALSVVHGEHISYCIGEPSVPSYVPGAMSVEGDRMNFISRVKNIVSGMLERQLYTGVYEREIATLRSKFGSQFKSYQELLAETSFVFTNSNPYLDYPRPMIHKTVPIGGITVRQKDKKDVLSEEWNTVLNRRNTTVLVSFGTVLKSVLMPQHYRKSILTVFESMPNTTFIWKYEEEGSRIASHLKNVHLRTWVPQNALLADPRLTVFVTHGGLGSTTEIAHSGKPSILIPLFADQTRNAQMLARHGGGIVLNKFDLESPDKLRAAIEDIFNDASFSQKAKRLSEMLLNKPVSPKELVIKHCEFAARFGRLPNLDPYGRHLSFVEYFLIDILLAVIGILAVFTLLLVTLYYDVGVALHLTTVIHLFEITL
ncbi:hypothetical protein Q1695_007385 [Nippostrongylus brasiliensis]|nr:hypothetical protein Q1695_007385 [Nippostrongylus brasiliensis]